MADQNVDSVPKTLLPYQTELLEYLRHSQVLEIQKNVVFGAVFCLVHFSSMMLMKELLLSMESATHKSIEDFLWPPNEEIGKNVTR